MKTGLTKKAERLIKREEKKRARNAKLELEASKKLAREARKLQRIADLESGILFKKANGYWALRYTLEKKEVVDSLKELSEERAKTLAPLCMLYIRRTGKRLGDITKVVADYQ